MSSCIYWFRNNLRLHDNPSLNKALANHDVVYPVFILPPDENSKTQTGLAYYGPHRLKFLVESVEHLQGQIRRLGGELSIFQGRSTDVLLHLARSLSANTIYASKEVGYHEQQEEVVLSKELQLLVEEDNFLVQSADVPKLLEKLPFGFSGFRKKVEKYWYARDTVSFTPGQFHDENLGTAQWPRVDGREDDRSAHPFSGGEKAGQERVENYLWKSGKIESYKFTRNGLIGTDYSSKFSAYLALGCLSPITIYKEVEKYERTETKNISTYWLKFELLWREFFRYVSMKYGHKLFLPGGIQQVSATWQKNERLIKRWMDGETEDDFVNANMIELKKTGFMSNRGRQNAASYLVHDLGQDWRMGAWYFERMLVDYDVASNWGNWQYVSGVGNDRRNRRFDTVWQADKYDGKRKFRKLWLSA